MQKCLDVSLEAEVRGAIIGTMTNRAKSFQHSNHVVALRLRIFSAIHRYQPNSSRIMLNSAHKNNLFSYQDQDELTRRNNGGVPQNGYITLSPSWARGAKERFNRCDCDIS